MRIRIIQVDGNLPNLALMNISAIHQSRGDEVVYTKSTKRDVLDGSFDRVYASSIFKWSVKQRERVANAWGGAVIWGGTGSDETHTVGQVVGSSPDLDYSHFQDFESSIGFSQRGCRLKCGFCVVPKKEGSVKSVKTIGEIWRGNGHKKQIILLDNDFFGQDMAAWKARLREAIDGKFKISFNQGLNVRLINQEACEWLSQVKYYDWKFKQRRIYTAWDNIGDEKIFFRGVGMMEKAGIAPNRIMAYMLIGYDPKETWDRLFYRYNKMVEMGISPYPMVYNNERKDLKKFQKWVVMRYAKFVPWEDFRDGKNFKTAKEWRATPQEGEEK